MTELNFPDILSALQDPAESPANPGKSCPLYFFEENSGMLFLKREQKIQPLLLIDDGSERALADLRIFAPQLISPKKLKSRFGLCIEKFFGQLESPHKKLPVFRCDKNSARQIC